MAQSTLPTLLITGSTGFLGQTLVERLAGDYRIIGLDHSKPEGELPEHVESIETDLSSDESVSNALDKVEDGIDGPIASVIHLAAYVDFSGEPSPLYDKVTVQGTKRLLDALNARDDLDVEQFIFSSTMLIHEGTEPGKPVREDSPLQGEWAYPESKIRTEQIIHEHHGSIPVVNLRLAGVYTDHCDSIPIAHQIQRIFERRMTSHVFPGDTDHGQSYVHLEDAVDAFVRAVERRDDLPQETDILIGEPRAASYQELQDTIARLAHGEDEWLTQQIPKPIAKTGAWVQDKVEEGVPGIEEPFIKPFMVDIADDHIELDISRARDLLGWEPQHFVLDSVPNMIDELRRDPAAWYERHDLGQPPAKIPETEEQPV
ncbi:MAG: NAD(P)-dependent oxidoreductase [Thermomicrobiales bacterium]